MSKSKTGLRKEQILTLDIASDRHESCHTTDYLLLHVQNKEATSRLLV